MSLRAPDRNYDPDAAPLRDLFLKVRREMAGRKAAGLPEPPPPPRPLAPSGPDWQEGQTVLAAAVRGTRVFDGTLGLGTILSVVPQHHKTEVLVRFDSGAEARRLRMVSRLASGPGRRVDGDSTMSSHPSSERALLGRIGVRGPAPQLRRRLEERRRPSAGSSATPRRSSRTRRTNRCVVAAGARVCGPELHGP